MKQVLFLCLLVATISIRVNAQTILYVDSSVSASGNGTSWSAAYKTVNEALNSANAGSTSVRYVINIAKGTYYPTGQQLATNRDSAFQLVRGGVSVFGGFPSGGGTRNASSNTVVLSGEIGTTFTSDNSYHVMVIVTSFATGDSILIDGLTITKGNASGVGNKNYYLWNAPRNCGGGIYNFSTTGRMTISNCILTDNIASADGGGMCSYFRNISIRQCRFMKNKANQGGGLFRDSYYTPCIINDSYFMGNLAYSNGGGICMLAAMQTSQITGSVFSGNMANLGGGLYDTVSFPVVTNCTFACDTALFGKGIYNTDYSPITIINSIVWEGQTNGIYNILNSIPSVTYSAVQGGYTGTGNRSGDPRFILPVFCNGVPTTGGDYHISPCDTVALNTGSNISSYTGLADVDGLPRLFGTMVDMGAYEVQSAYLGVSMMPITGISTLCPLATTQLAIATGGGTWSSSNPAIASVSSTGLVTALYPGTDTILYTVPGACNTIATRIITVLSPSPVGTITGPGNVCSGSTIALSNVVSGGTWSSSTASITTVSTTGIVTGVSAGIDTVTYSVTGTCPNKATRIITVFPVPIVSPITGDSTVCLTAVTVLSTTTGGGTWTSSNTSLATVGNSGLVTGVSVGIDTIMYTVNNGCVTQVIKPVRVLALPAAPGISTPLTYCKNATATQLTATGTSLQWYTASSAGTASTTAPTPVTTSAGTTSYWVSQTDIPGCESPRAQITVNVLPEPVKPIASGNTPLCVGDTLRLSASASAGNHVFSWTGPAFSSSLQNPIIAAASASTAGVYRVTVTDSGCVSAPDSLKVVVTCFDSVWAGDANYDRIVDNLDALLIALTMNSTGPARNTTSIGWQATHSWNWSTTLPGYPTINRKHADCNGDGTVSYSDTLAVTANYGLTHPKGVRSTTKKTAGDPDLYFDLSGIAVGSGMTITVPIKLGTAATPMQNVAGIAARLMIDGVTPVAIPTISYASSWLGTNANTLRFGKDVSNSRIDWAYGRTDHSNASGSGTIAWLTFAVPMGVQGQEIHLYFDQVILVDSNGEKITGVNIIDDTIAVLNDPTGVSQRTGLQPQIQVLPNPSSGSCRVQVTLPAPADYSLEVRDLSGRLVWRSTGFGATGSQSIGLPTGLLCAGMYLVSLRSEGHTATPVRWIKQD